MNWKWTHTVWSLIAAAAEPAYESLQGQPLTKATLWHAGSVWLLAMVMLLHKSPRDGATTPPAN